MSEKNKEPKHHTITKDKVEYDVEDVKNHAPNPGDANYVDPTYVRPMNQVNPDPELAEAKNKYIELNQKWETLTDQQKHSPEGKGIHDELNHLHTFIKHSDKDVADVPAIPAKHKKEEAPVAVGQVDTRTPKPTHLQNGGKNKAKSDGLTDKDFMSKSPVKDPTQSDIPGEQTVDRLGKPAGFNEFYHGDHAVNADNELLKHLPSDEYDKNKARENR